MATPLREVMTPNPTCVPETATLVEAARHMRDRDIGDVIVLAPNSQIAGVLTDRDIVVRCVAEQCDPTTTEIGEVSSRDIISLGPDDTVENAIRQMRNYSIRRLPIVENGKPVGIVSIGDLALERDPDSALADISGAPSNNKERQ